MALVTAAFDVRCALSESISELYEAIYVKIHELSNVLVAKGADENNISIVCSRVISSIFLSSSSRCFKSDELWEKGTGKFHLGKLNNRWQLYLDDALPDDRLELESDKGNAVLTLENFIHAD